MQPLDSSFPLGEGDWTNVIIPGDMNNPGFTHLRSYLISGLLPESEYECLVQARNRFGWSDASRLFTFFTSTKGEAEQSWEMFLKSKYSSSCFRSGVAVSLHFLLTASSLSVSLKSFLAAGSVSPSQSLLLRAAARDSFRKISSSDCGTVGVTVKFLVSVNCNECSRCCRRSPLPHFIHSNNSL